MSDIPYVETYKGVGVHDCQPVKRIETIVKPAIDYVLELDGLDQLAAYAGDITRPPEARLLALAKCEATFQLAVNERRARPIIDMDRVAASAHSCGSNYWRSPWYYCSSLDIRGPVGLGHPQPAMREVPLTDEYRRGSRS